MYNTVTQTYTVIDIKKTFEGFEADLRMIARRTGKWSISYTENVFHDIIKLAECKYLSQVSITLENTNGVVLKAAKYAINESGTSISGDRAGGNEWQNLPNTILHVVISYSPIWKQLSVEQKNKFRRDNSFKVSWENSNIDTNFSHLKRSQAQTYASNGYELKKENFS